MKKNLTKEQFVKKLQEEIDKDIEQVEVTYCCPLFLGGYKREDTHTFPTDIESIANSVNDRCKGGINIAKITTGYKGYELPRWTLFVDVIC